MAHFAQLNENNIVQQVIVVDNKHAQNEQAGIDYIKNVLKLDGVWLQTSYNGSIRGKFAGIMDLYDSEKDLFIEDPAYLEVIENRILENRNKQLTNKTQKEAIAAKIGLTVEELQAILKQ